MKIQTIGQRLQNTNPTFSTSNVINHIENHSIINTPTIIKKVLNSDATFGVVMLIVLSTLMYFR